jgi:hypothetical protein
LHRGRVDFSIPIPIAMAIAKEEANIILGAS